jgi:hypothetical protein
MAALLSGSLFVVIESLLPPRTPEPLTIAVSQWAGDQALLLIAPLEIVKPEALALDLRPISLEKERAEAFRDGRAQVITGSLETVLALGLDDLRLIYVLATEASPPRPHVLAVRRAALGGGRSRRVQLLRALDAVVQRCRPALESCLEPLAKASDRPVVEWRTAFQGVQWLDLKANQALLEPGAGPLAQSLRAAAGSRPTGDWIDPSLAREAAAP